MIFPLFVLVVVGLTVVANCIDRPQFWLENVIIVDIIFLTTCITEINIHSFITLIKKKSANAEEKMQRRNKSLIPARIFNIFFY